MSAVPGPIYGLEVAPGEVLVTSQVEFPAAFRITMAALDPTQEPQADEEGNVAAVSRSTLRLVRRVLPTEEEEDEDEEVDPEYLKVLLGGSDDEDDEANGGPSDPAKAKQHKRAAAIQKFLEAAKEQDAEDEEMEDAEAKPKGNKDKFKPRPKGKGKGKAVVKEEEGEDEDEDDLGEEGDLDHFVLCTLDTDKHYQQPLDITVNQGEKVWFVVSGTHTVYLTGNYLMDDRDLEEEEGREGEEEEEEEGDEEYDMEDLDFVVGDEVSDAESDELDDIDNPRITEVDSDEEAPKLVPTKKGKNKRSAEEQAGGLDELIAKAVDAKAAKASKKQEKQQQKKLKNNKGEAVVAEDKQQEVKQEAKQDGKKDNKKKDNKKDAKKTVQFAKNLEQGPTGSTEKLKQAGPKPSVTKIQGVTVDDRTVGRGRTAKTGDTVGVRYIGKLMNGQQFDANKKGKPFSFKLGKGQVIRGWDIGITGMAIGGERRLTIPHHLAYGSKSLPGIPSNSTLVFDVKLLEIK